MISIMIVLDRHYRSRKPPPQKWGDKLAFVTVVMIIAILSANPGIAKDRVPIGIGIEHLEVDKDLPHGNPKGVFTIEYFFKLAHKLELNIGCAGTTEDVEIGDASYMTYNGFWIGPRYTFGNDGIRPYIETGFMKHKHTSHEDQSLLKVRGRGPYVTSGLIIPLGQAGYSINLYLKHASWEGEDNNSLTDDRYDVSTTIIGLNLGPWILYLFGFAAPGGY